MSWSALFDRTHILKGVPVDADIEMQCSKCKTFIHAMNTYYTDIKLIYAHAGLPYYRKIWPHIKEKKNVYVDLFSPYLDEPLRRETVWALGADKCLYGSDRPFGYPAEDNMYDHGSILEEITHMPLSAAEKEKYWVEILSIKWLDNFPL